MSKISKTLSRVLRGDTDANIRFDDIVSLLRHLGFVERIRGSHHIFARDGVVEILNLQSRERKAKSYQVKQVRDVIVGYGLVEPSASEESPDVERDPTETEEDDG